MKGSCILMGVMFCKIHCPLMCFCKPSVAARFYASGPLKFENGASHFLPSTASSYAVCDDKSSSSSSSSSSSCEGVIKSCIRKIPCGHEGVGKKRVQWMDSLGKELAEIKEFESSDKGHTDNEDESGRCFCVIL